jgi:hypothetical protein
MKRVLHTVLKFQRPLWKLVVEFLDGFVLLGVDLIDLGLVLMKLRHPRSKRVEFVSQEVFGHHIIPPLALARNNAGSDSGATAREAVCVERRHDSVSSESL